MTRLCHINFVQVIDPGIETEYEAVEEICYCHGSKDRLIKEIMYYLNNYFKTYCNQFMSTAFVHRFQVTGY